MAKKRLVEPVISETAQEELKVAASEVVRKVKEIFDQVNAEAKEFQKRRKRVRERIESGVRKTDGRIV